jgi:16S rRNA (guanine527-N7)-methyltransferase
VQNTADRLDDRAKQAGLFLPPLLAEKLLAYYHLLKRWNRKINLTSLANLDDAIDRLLLEPVAAAVQLPQGPRMMDLGSGGGSPAIPLGLALNAPLLVMVESRSRKAAFLREAARELGLTAAVENARFEDLGPDHRETMDLVSIRAVRIDAPALDAASRFLKPGGILALFRSADAFPLDALPAALVSRKTVPLINRAELQIVERV